MERKKPLSKAEKAKGLFINIGGMYTVENFVRHNLMRAKKHGKIIQDGHVVKDLKISGNTFSLAVTRKDGEGETTVYTWQRGKLPLSKTNPENPAAIFEEPNFFALLDLGFSEYIQSKCTSRIESAKDYNSLFPAPSLAPEINTILSSKAEIDQDSGDSYETTPAKKLEIKEDPKNNKELVVNLINKMTQTPEHEEQKNGFTFLKPSHKKYAGISILTPDGTKFAVSLGYENIGYVGVIPTEEEGKLRSFSPIDIEKPSTWPDTTKTALTALIELAKDYQEFAKKDKMSPWTQN